MDEGIKKTVLRKIPYGLYVIGVKQGGSCHAFTGSWLSQCSMKPPRVMLGVRQGSRSLEEIRQGGIFSINFISKKDRKIIEQFFKPAPSDGNRFGELKFTSKRTGAPILEAAIHYLECRVKEILDAGDHSIVVGEVVEAQVVRDEAPLIMSDTPWHYGG